MRNAATWTEQTCQYGVAARRANRHPVKPLRELVHRAIADSTGTHELWDSSAVTYASLARSLGYVRSDQGRPDTARLKRQLGILPHHTRDRSGQHRVSYAQTVSCDIAAAIVRACDRDPHEIGL